ncbi:MAG: ArsR family transcriptional regulator [Cytophagales bacterium]
MLETLITSKTRIKLLVKFFSNAHSKGYLRSLANEFGESTNAIRLELNNLSEAGFLVSEEAGRTIEYRANSKHPLFPELKNLAMKYLGLDKIAEEVVQKLGDVKGAFIHGDYTKGIDSGLIDLVLIGHVNRDNLHRLVVKAEKMIKRKIRAMILSEEEFVGLKDKLEADQAIWLWKG